MFMGNILVITLKMTKQEFRKLAIDCGYNSAKLVDKWLAKNNKCFYTEEDFVSVYRMREYEANYKFTNIENGRTTKRYVPLGIDKDEYFFN